jgi:hypothetical protein
MADAPGDAAGAAWKALAHPYMEGDNPLDGLGCYFPGCPYKGYTWSSIMQHIKKKHSVKYSSIEGTYLGQQGKKEINQQQNSQYAARKQAKATQRQSTEHKDEGVKVGPTALPVLCVW